MQRFIFTVLLSFCLSLLMSAWVTFLNLGLSPMFLSKWMHAFLLAWPPAFLIAYFFAPLVNRLSIYLTKKWSH